MTEPQDETAEARAVCDHFYASHCRMSIRLCMTCGEPDWDDLERQLGGTAGTITQAELAEAWEHEVDGCYAGGREFAVNVFAYVRERRKPNLITEWPSASAPLAPAAVPAAGDPSEVLSSAHALSREAPGGSEAEPHMDLLEMAWGVIANAGWDDSAKTTGWQEAAERWRNDYHRWLDLHLRPGGYQTWEELALSVTRERDALLFEVSQLQRAARDFRACEPVAAIPPPEPDTAAMDAGEGMWQERAEYWHKRWTAALDRADEDGTRIVSQGARIGELEQKLAELRSVLLEGGQDAGTARRRAIAIVTEEESNARNPR